jgi:hypothetical protein
MHHHDRLQNKLHQKRFQVTGAYFNVVVGWYTESLLGWPFHGFQLAYLGVFAPVFYQLGYTLTAL